VLGSINILLKLIFFAFNSFSLDQILLETKLSPMTLNFDAILCNEAKNDPNCLKKSTETA